MNAVDRGEQKLILFFGSIALLYGLYHGERCYRTGEWVIKLRRNLEYTGELAMFAIAAMVVVGGFFVVTSLRHLQDG
jgi:hypothetical protein